jgi:Na+/H+ antiporter NhaD/arsenite permease-like protein
MNHLVLAVVIFIFFYGLIITEKVPRSVAVLLGSFLLIAFNIIDQEQAIHAIDFNTIGLLFGMMQLVAIMGKTGIFEYIAVKAIKLSKGNLWNLLILFSITTAIMSALLDNVTTVLIIAPITIALADAAHINPIPYLIMEVFASNIGGTATLIGDPPNIIIGSAVKFGFMDFIENNLPIVIIVFIVYLLIIKFIYRKEFNQENSHEELISLFDEKRIIENFSKLKRTMTVFVITMLLFVTHKIHGLEAATIALGGGFLLLLITKHDPEDIYGEIEHSTLIFLVGIFILVGGLEHVHAIDYLSNFLAKFTQGSEKLTTLMVLWFSGLSTSFVNNIPFTTVMIPIVKSLKATTNISSDSLWWALSLGACFGGNGSLAGSAANIVVIELARKDNININFWDYFKIAFPLMLVSLVLSSVYMLLRY